MKKIGFLFGKNKSFSEELIDYINDKKLKSLKAEEITLGALSMDGLSEYNVIFDSISNKVRFYNSVLKSAVLNGVKVINNPFWDCADDNFLHSALTKKMDINTPRTAILPSKHHPDGTSADSFMNLMYPLNWEEVFEYVGFPSVLKPVKGGGVYNEYTVYDINEFFSAYDLTGKDTMIFQEKINYDRHFRCFVIGKEEVIITNYNPNNPIHMRYSDSKIDLTKEEIDDMKQMSIKICNALGFDFNAIDFGFLKDKLFIYDLINATPVSNRNIMTDKYFDELVRKMGDYLIKLSKARKVVKKNFVWTDLLTN